MSLHQISFSEPQNHVMKFKEYFEEKSVASEFSLFKMEFTDKGNRDTVSDTVFARK